MDFFVVACYELAKQDRGALFAVCAVLGLFSHATFAFALAAFAVWKWRPRWFAAPIAVFILFWMLDWSDMIYLGGTPEPLLGTLRHLARATLGTPLGPLELLAIPALVVAVVALRRSSERVLYTAIFLVPAAVLAVKLPSFIAPRYFLVWVPFFLILLAEMPRLAIAAVVLLNVTAIARLDRGHPKEVVQYMAAHTAGEAVTLSSDNKFRNWIELEYYARAEAKRFEYLDGQGALWYVAHDFSDEPRPPAIDGYSLVLRTPWFGLSGWRFFVYRAGGPAGPDGPDDERRKLNRLGQDDTEPSRREHPRPDGGDGDRRPGREVTGLGKRPEQGDAEAAVGERVEQAVRDGDGGAEQP
jgi:hypothetical protein